MAHTFPTLTAMASALRAEMEGVTSPGALDGWVWSATREDLLGPGAEPWEERRRKTDWIIEVAVLAGYNPEIGEIGDAEGLSITLRRIRR